MTQYIYFVKCPDCEDEIFDFFDEAEKFALSCLSKKPIITQTEVERNDFGECTDSCDLGTIWSWEDIIGEETEDKPAISIFNKDDLNSSTNCEDSEFDNDVFKVFNDLIKDEHEAIDGYESAEDVINQYDFSSEDKDIILSTLAHIKAEEEEHIDELEKLPYENAATERKPIPDGMTLKELVEEMEENEDTVECSWCKDLFDKSECRYEVNLGWLCDRCQAAIMSRGEPLTFRENNYWDFLDEEDKDISAGDRVWTCVFDDQEIGTVTAKTKEEAIEKMQYEYPEYPYGIYDGCFDVYLKEDMKKLTEEFADEVELEYFGFEDDYGPDSYTYRVDRNKVIEYIIDYEIEHLSDEEIKTLLKLTKAPEEYSEEEYFQAIEENFDEVFKKFEGDIYDYFREDCEEEYYSQDWERIAFEQAMEFQWECDNDK